jgi:DNA-binding beta-propeller fold protein YncE
MRVRASMFAIAVAVAVFAAGTGYKVVKKIPIPGEGGWDYITYDAAGARLFVAHATKVDVVDANAGKAIGEIPKAPGVHGIALVQEAGKGYISAGEANTIIEFDLKTLKVVGHIPAGTKPDAIVYDEGSRRVLVSNGDSDDMTVIDPFHGRSVGRLRWAERRSTSPATARASCG